MEQKTVLRLVKRAKYVTKEITLSECADLGNNRDNTGRRYMVLNKMKLKITFLRTVGVEPQKCIAIMESTEIDCTQKIWSERLNINKVVTFKLDTGADCNVMSIKMLQALGVGGKLRASMARRWQH